MKLSIAKQLKKQSQVQIAFLQDEIMEILYSLTDDLIFHGGTVIWRCYNGKKFSEDLNFYYPSLMISLLGLRSRLSRTGRQFKELKILEI
ncbi:MAG: hypothetical protein AAE984_07575 [Cuniculiplasma divulgatum]